MKSEYTANQALAIVKPHNWIVGKNFAKPLPKRKPLSLLAKLLKVIK